MAMQLDQHSIVKPRPAVVMAAWGLAAVAYTPAVWMVNQGQGQAFGLLTTFASVLLFFTPWALITRPLIGLCARLPVGSGETARSLGGLFAIGIVLVPLLTFAGYAANAAALALLGTYPARSLQSLLNATLISSLFSVPLYAAVVAVGQTLVWFERTRRSERLLLQARLDALRAQVNPHFLFNALNAVGELTHDNPTAAQEGIRRLSSVLRASLATGEQSVPLRTEIASLKDQIELHRLLLPGDLEVDLTVSPAAWNARVPTLILQPLVENAFVHALSQLTGKAWLKINANTDSDRLRINITNALPPQRRPSRGLGVGLSNVRGRLQAAYGDRAALTVHEASETFAVELSLPLQAVPEAVDI